MTRHIARELLFFVFACPLAIFADGVTITSSCSLTNYTRTPFVPINTVSQTGAGNCSLTLVNPTQGTGFATTQTFVTLDLPVPGNPAAPVGARISAGSAAFPSTDSFSDSILQSGSAAISLALDLTFTTAGPPRAGYIQSSQRASLGVNSSNGGDRPDSQTAGIAVGPLSLTCPGSPGTDVINGCGGSLQAFPGQLVPFSLGENFLFHEEAGMLTATDARPSAIEDGTIGVNFTFRLFEADGVTPVQIALVTPEPGSLALWAFGLSASLAFRRKQGETPSYDI
jgi:hypothetical protein